MGFRLGRTYLLEFDEDHDLHGVQIRMRWGSILLMEEISSMTFTEGWPKFLDHVVSWNFETEDGTPLDPKDVDAVNAAMEPAYRPVLISAWMRAAYGVTAPLAQRSPAGGESPTTEDVELSIPMETLSSLPASTSTPN